MAKETKVGLLAGLAFIICFAIILSNRGQRAPAKFADLGTSGGRPHLSDRRPTRSTTAPRTRPASARPDGNAPSGNVNLSVGRIRGRPAPERNARQPGPAAGARKNDDAPPSTGSDLVVSRDPARHERSHVTSGPSGSATRTAQPPADRQQLLRERLDEIAAERGLESPATAPMERRPNVRPTTGRSPTNVAGKPSALAQPPVVLGRYEVQSGDTLSSIASRQYGSRARRFIDGIVDANRAVVSDPNRIRPGMELLLPVIDGVKPAVPASNEPPAGREVRSSEDRRKSAPPKSFRWYQIRPNDRYVTIAREQLGDGSRWREIYKLNIEKFPDPGLIRPGVRIKLPAEEVVSKTPRSRP